MQASELADLIDRYDTIKQGRLDHDRKSRMLKEEEVAMKAAIISHLRESELTSAGGNTVLLTIVKKTRIETDDWSKLTAYIKENDAFDVLYRRLNEKAIRDRLEGREEIPGIRQELYDDLSESRAHLKTKD